MTNPSYLSISEKYARTIIVGDIHGCIDEFMQLLSMLRFSEDDLLITVGDMVDRGPGSWDVARFFKENTNAYSVLGNHERRIAGIVRGSLKPAWSQKHALSLLPKEEWSSWATYFEGLPAVLETDNVIVTHARLDPESALDMQDPYHTCAVGGYRVHIKQDADGVPTWFRSMQLDKPICIGHIGYSIVELVSGRLFALDTQSCTGGSLTAVIFPEGEIISVPSQRNYKRESKKTWELTEIASQPEETWRLSLIDQLCSGKGLMGLQIEKELAESAEEKIASMDLGRKCTALRQCLCTQFGDYPNPGPGRKDYIDRVRFSFPEHSQGMLAVMLLTGREMRINDWMRLPGITMLKDVDMLLDSFSIDNQ